MSTLKPGTRVKIQDKLRYDGKLYGLVGVIDRYYMPSVNFRNAYIHGAAQAAVKFKNLANPNSKDGVFWFFSCDIKATREPETTNMENINISERKTAMQNFILPPKGTALIKFPNGTNQNKTYLYARYDDVAPGDTVIVQTGHHGLSVATVSDIDTDPVDNVQYGREIVCVADTTAYEKRKTDRARLAELERTMQARVANLQNLRMYQLMAQVDPSLKDMLNEYTAIAGITLPSADSQD